MADMKIAYVLGKYPCLSETFAAGQIAALREMGQRIFVFASDGRSRENRTDVFYKPTYFSADGIYSVLIFFYHKAWLFFQILVAGFLPVCRVSR